MKYLLYLLSVISLLSFSLLVIAKDNPDDLLPIQISSDSFEFNNTTGVATYKGKVEVTQGSRQLTSTSLNIYRSKDGSIDRMIAVGSPAKYQGQTDPKKPLLYAHADTIEYYVQKELLILMGHAEVEQAGDKYQAPRIEYDSANERINSHATSSGRTTITIQPRDNKNKGL